MSPTTPIPTTASPTTPSPTTSSPTTSSPTSPTLPPTSSPTTFSPTTASPTTAFPTTSSPTTAFPTTRNPTTLTPTVPPTVDPTRKPTEMDVYDHFIDVSYLINNLSVSEISAIAIDSDALVSISEITQSIETGYTQLDRSVFVEFFLDQGGRIEQPAYDIRAYDIDLSQSLEWNNNPWLAIHANILCPQLICSKLIDVNENQKELLEQTVTQNMRALLNDYTVEDDYNEALSFEIVSTSSQTQALDSESTIVLDESQSPDFVFYGF
eukprot:CAMPEP_0202734092 /NCGR_PEP_ID=MMETSP1385-20130828/188503_1 /ASSEMBLY_ACC=CAM_ASM_000861 /TAXON_ID=933848 /ORGANISM="Elphidium margaritaceum" /LENGTH=266 /DNA_ID=CAMNT_0049400437 /DNA_START=15 /DNA_END=813 /DNA_ORIENTATION=-